MKRASILLVTALLLLAGVQTVAAQSFRVYQSDGTELQFSMKTDSIVFDNGLSGDEVFGPFTPVNFCIAGTWYLSKTQTVTFSADGTTDYVSGATYKFFPYQGNLVIYNEGGAPLTFFRVLDLTSEKLLVNQFGSNVISQWSATRPPQLVTSITLSETSITLQPSEMKTLTATVLPADADNKEVEWTSSDETVAVVGDFFGTITVMAKSFGTCTITCSATDGSGVKGECQVTVGEPAMEDEQTFTVNGVSFKMKKVEGGTFMMGSSDDDSEAFDNEKPRHQVTLSSFSIGETEVTQALWYAVMGEKPTSSISWSTDRGLGDNYPAYFVSWDDCQTFITKLNQLTGKTFRLPTEAEWEYAARGGNKSQGYIFSGSNTIGNVAWYDSNSGSSSHPVATKAPNELGIYDMSGNVMEWCQDWYGSYSSGSQTNPAGPSSGSYYRMSRGGGWNFIASICRVALRFYDTPTGISNSLGLRLAQ